MEEIKKKEITKTPLYYWLIIVSLVLHMIFQLTFAYLDNLPMSIYNLLSVMVFSWGAYWIYRNQRLTIWVCFLEATIFIALAVMTMGWEYRFQNWYFAFFILSITVPFKKKLGFYLLALVQMVAYVFLFIMVKEEFVLSLTTIFAGVNLSFVFILMFFAERLLKMSKAMEILFLQNEMQEMEQKNYLDELTGLMTRRRMNAILSEMQEHLRNETIDFYLIFADIDKFKNINDSFGHDCGDQVLISVSDILNHELRGEDVVARWGGEEFLIILRNPKYPSVILEQQQVHDILNRLRRKIEETEIYFGETKIKVTMTFGGISSQGYQDIQQMIRDADEQMYQGKRTGRNRVILKPMTAEMPMK